MVVPQKLRVRYASRKVALPEIVRPPPTSHSKLDSTPLLTADAAFCTTVTLFGPRYENWKLFQFSQKTAPFHRRCSLNHWVFQPIS